MLEVLLLPCNRWAACSVSAAQCRPPCSMCNGLTAAGLPLFTGLLKRELRSGYC